MTIKEAEEKVEEIINLARESDMAARETQAYAIQTLATIVKYLLKAEKGGK